MQRERIGFDRLPPARIVECYACGESAPIDRTFAWPSIVVLPVASHEPMYARTESYDALGRCPTCAAKHEAVFIMPIAEPEPQATLF